MPRRWAETQTPFKTRHLISRYPAVSHSFILREILELRKRGIGIEVASIKLIRDQVDGLLVPPSDLGHLKLAMERLLGDEQLVYVDNRVCC